MLKKTFLILAIIVSITCQAQSEKRLALVVGNAEYVDKSSYLENPVNDANDVSAKLKTLGFEVTTVRNASYLELEDAIDAFGAKAKDYDVALFYYSGHGVQTNGENYLVPVDFKITTTASVRARCSSVNYLLDMLDESGCPLKIVCLDACRDNPFERSRGFSKGLSGVDASEGTLVSFATAKGKIAADGDGHNSPYTTAFLNALDQPNLKILDFFNTIANRVKSLTQNTQMPWANFSSLNGDFCFNKNATSAPSVVQAQTLTQPTPQKPSTTQPQPETVSAPTVTPRQTSPTPPTDTKSELLSQNGVFSVAPSRKVHFAPSNLQYQASTNTWRFAPNPWDVIGKDNENISPTYSGWIDLFGWGTGDIPTKVSIENNDYSMFTDWGQNMGKGWRTLKDDEWEYVFEKRTTVSETRFALAKVNNVNGVILLPDNWSNNYYNLNNPNNRRVSFNSNVISASTWIDSFQANGAVFLPAAGWYYRLYGGSLKDIGYFGRYWSASYYIYDDKSYAYTTYFGNGNLGTHDGSSPYNGYSVRLVLPAK